MGHQGHVGGGPAASGDHLVGKKNGYDEVKDANEFLL